MLLIILFKVLINFFSSLSSTNASLNAIAFRDKMLFTDLASLPCPTLIDHILMPPDLWCKTLLSFSSQSAKWRKQRVFFLY